MYIFIIMAVVVAILLAAFLFLQPKMDPRIKKLAELAYKTAGEINDLPVRGSSPPVRLRKKPKGNIIGSYWALTSFKKVLYDSIWVVNNERFMWPNIVHEQTHAIRRRNGLGSSEAKAERAEAMANHPQYRTPLVEALLLELYS